MNANSSSTTNTVKFKRRCMTAPVGPLHARALQQRQSEQSRVTSSRDAALSLARPECTGSGGSQSSALPSATRRAARRGWHSCASAHGTRHAQQLREGVRAWIDAVRGTACVRNSERVGLASGLRSVASKSARKAPAPPAADIFIHARAPCSLLRAFAPAPTPCLLRVSNRAPRMRRRR